MIYVAAQHVWLYIVINVEILREKPFYKRSCYPWGFLLPNDQKSVCFNFMVLISSTPNIVCSPPSFDLQMNDNQIDNWSDLDELKNTKSLETVYLERNPLQKDPQYRRKIMLALPSVRQIDATFIRFWGASVPFNRHLQCSLLLPPWLPYLQKKEKKHNSSWTHTCLTELCSHSEHKHIVQLWTRHSLFDVHVCTHSRHGLIY